MRHTNRTSDYTVYCTYENTFKTSIPFETLLLTLSDLRLSNIQNNSTPASAEINLLIQMT